MPPSLIDCIQDLIRYDPRARLTTQQCMEHPYFLEDAPRMQPVASRPPPPPQQQQQKPTQVPISQLNRWPGPLQAVPTSDRMAVDPSPAQRAVPPSHSNQSQTNKQPFGSNAPADFRQLPPLRALQGQNGQPLHRVPFFPQGGDPNLTSSAPIGNNSHSRTTTEDPGSPMREDGASDVQWAPRPGMPTRDSGVSQYPAFPDSASLYAGSHASYAPSQASTQYDERLPNSSSYRDGASDAQTSNATTVRDNSQARRSEQARHTVYDDELSRQHQLQQQQQQQQQLHAPNAAKAGSSSELSELNDSTGSTETINSKEKRRSRAWGLNISSVFSGSGPSSPGLQQQRGDDGQSRQADSMEEKRRDPQQQPAPVNAAPLDPKKAKKEAEKQAREQRAAQDKAKRAAQEKAARDRARAVMHKRNQLLASTHGKDQVEWLAVGTGVEELNQPSEKSRGKQPLNGMSSSQTFNPNSSSGVSPEYSVGRPSQSNHSIASSGFGSGNGSQSSASAAWTARGPGQGRLTQSQSKRQIDDDPYSPTYGLESPELGRLRMESSGEGRRISIQSYATGESDPGPAPNMPRHPAALQRATSSSSLSSAPSMVDSAGRFAPSLSESRNSQDNRSISSLDHQLITNMENMTAAGTPGGSGRTPGNVSPGHGHYFGSRPSVSRQSRGASRASSSHNRQGSSSPLHHASGVPRFHPYSHGSNQPGSSHSHQSFTLPPLHGLNDGGASRSSSRRNRGLSQGSVGSDRDGSHYPLASPAMHYATMQGEAGGVNPMFQVSEQDQEMASSPQELHHDSLMLQRQASAGGTVLPPFSHIAAVANSEEDGGQHRQRQPHSASPTSNVFYSNHA